MRGDDVGSGEGEKGGRRGEKDALFRENLKI